MSVECQDRAPGVAAGGVLFSVAVALTALNLRPAVTSVGPLLDETRGSLGASETWAGLLTTVPVLCFAIAGLVAPLLARRAGVGAAVGIALAMLAGGLVVRVLDGPLLMIGGTLVAAAGIAFAGVLIPVVVKESFPALIGLMTGVYTASLQLGATLGSALTPPLDTALGGWRPALASWAALAVLALVVWTAAARRGGFRAAAQADRQGRSLLRNRLAWIITVFFGLQALLAFVVIGWLPRVLMDVGGVSRGEAGLLLGLLALLALPISLVVPALAARRGSQSGWIVGLGACGLAGLLGLLLAPSFSPLLWTVLLGLGMSVFSLALTTIALRARTSEDTAKLSGMAQGFGYLLAAAGPFLFGLLHDVTGGWTVPFLLLIGVLVVQIGFGALAGRPRYV
ncbi:MFS transporter [Nonomuraea africana]|uniref:CP family cyanate transporter-like MFS transporter n=1 Tax=Nonomuraea africana TaxID=46171 RepID=A0ABR9KL89_9ACTN|nr:MFS transporter [Nonomuraea africana]MBE1562786.1 CP family cyanate transporter-like MFS transporter [Nonomuraea africana]